MDPSDAFPPGWHETNVRAILQIQVLVAEVEQLEAELKKVEKENLGLVQTNDMLRNANSKLRKQVADAELGNCVHPWDRRATSFDSNAKPQTRCSVCGETIPNEEPNTIRPPMMTEAQRQAFDESLSESLKQAFSDEKKRFRHY